jgi:hypothetical protein
MVKVSRMSLEKLRDFLLMMEPPEDHSGHDEWDQVWNLLVDLQSEVGGADTLAAIALKPGTKVTVAGRGFTMQLDVD